MDALELLGQFIGRYNWPVFVMGICASVLLGFTPESKVLAV